MGILEDIEPGHGGGAGGRRKEASEDPHGGGLAGAVRPQKTDDLALLHLEGNVVRSEEHTSELQSLRHLVCRLLLEKKKTLYRSYSTRYGWMRGAALPRSGARG